MRRPSPISPASHRTKSPNVKSSKFPNVKSNSVITVERCMRPPSCCRCATAEQKMSTALWPRLKKSKPLLKSHTRRGYGHKTARVRAAPNPFTEFPLRSAVSDHQKEIRVAGLFARSGDHGVSLSAMVGLMIEEMGHQQTARLPQFSVRGGAQPDHLLRKPLRGDALRPGVNFVIGFDTRLAKLVKAGDQRRAVLLDHCRLGPTVEARHPHLVAPKQMTQRAVDGTPESTTGKSPRCIRQP